MDPVAAATKVAADAVKVAQALKDRLDKVAGAPKPVDAAVVQKTASALVDGGWIKEAQRDNALVALSDPTQALTVLFEVATKAAEAIDDARARAGMDPRLATGTAVTPPQKTASDNRTEWLGSRPENEHDRDFMDRILAYRQQMNGSV